MRDRLIRVLKAVGRFPPLAWLRQQYRKFYRKVEFSIMVRDMAAPDVELPRGRRSPVGDTANFNLVHATEEHLPALRATFDRRRYEALKECIEDPNTDVVINTDGGERVWCFMCHGTRRQKDSFYQIDLPIEEGRDILQFDGWVHPEYRGTMIGILGTNTGNRWRRAEGFERLYVFVRKSDLRSRRLHKRMSFREVGSVYHTRLGPLRFNRYEWEPGERPDQGREPREQLSRLGVQMKSPWAEGQEPEDPEVRSVGYLEIERVQEPLDGSESGSLGTGDAQNRVYT